MKGKAVLRVYYEVEEVESNILIVIGEGTLSAWIGVSVLLLVVILVTVCWRLCEFIINYLSVKDSVSLMLFGVRGENYSDI